MKQNTFLKITLIITVSLILTFSYSCTKNYSISAKNPTAQLPQTIPITQIESILNNYHNQVIDPKAIHTQNIFKKIIAWLIEHAGTPGDPDPSNCNLPNGCCGPCRGICWSGSNRPTLVDSGYTLSADQISNSYALFKLIATESDTTMIVSLISTSYLVNAENNLFINADGFMGNDISTVFGVDSLFIKSGLYPVSYKYDSRGETVVNVRAVN